MSGHTISPLQSKSRENSEGILGEVPDAPTATCAGRKELVLLRRLSPLSMTLLCSNQSARLKALLLMAVRYLAEGFLNGVWKKFLDDEVLYVS